MLLLFRHAVCVSQRGCVYQWPRKIRRNWGITIRLLNLTVTMACNSNSSGEVNRSRVSENALTPYTLEIKELALYRVLRRGFEYLSADALRVKVEFDDDKQTLKLTGDELNALEKLKDSIRAIEKVHKIKLDVPKTADVWKWARDVLNEEQVAAILVEECDGDSGSDWYVAACDQATSSRAVDCITRSMLTGKLPYGGRCRASILDYTLSAGWGSFVASMENKKSVNIRCTPTSITVYGLPRDVIASVSAIEDRLAAETRNYK